MVEESAADFEKVHLNGHDGDKYKSTKCVYRLIIPVETYNGFSRFPLLLFFPR